jgi:hypothetical protein
VVVDLEEDCATPPFVPRPRAPRYANASGLESKLFGCLGAEPSYHSIILHVITRCCHLLGSLVLHALVFRYYCC